MSFITKILESILPFLFSALKRSWDSLTPVQQQAIVNSGLIGQYLKNNLNVLSGDLVAAIAKGTGLPQDMIETTLLTLAGKLGYSGALLDEGVAFLQNKLSTAASNEEWNGLLTIVLQAGANALSGGSFSWLQLALGLAEYGYRKFVEPLTGITLNIPSVDVTNAAAPVEVAAPEPTV